LKNHSPVIGDPGGGLVSIVKHQKILENLVVKKRGLYVLNVIMNLTLQFPIYLMVSGAHTVKVINYAQIMIVHIVLIDLLQVVINLNTGVY
jgi:hypothetical protein